MFIIDAQIFIDELFSLYNNIYVTYLSNINVTYSNFLHAYQDTNTYRKLIN